MDKGAPNIIKAHVSLSGGLIKTDSLSGIVCVEDPGNDMYIQIQPELIGRIILSISDGLQIDNAKALASVLIGKSDTKSKEKHSFKIKGQLLKDDPTVVRNAENYLRRKNGPQ